MPCFAFYWKSLKKHQKKPLPSALPPPSPNSGDGHSFVNTGAKPLLRFTQGVSEFGEGVGVGFAQQIYQSPICSPTMTLTKKGALPPLFVDVRYAKLFAFAHL